MPRTTYTFFDASETPKAAQAGANETGEVASAVVLVDEDGSTLAGQAATASSLPVAVSTEQQALIAAIAQEATQQAVQTLLDEIKTAIQALTKPTDTQAVSGTVATGGLTDAELRAAPVSVAQADAATSTKQDTLAAAVGLLAKLTDTQPVSLASAPLPEGAATENSLIDVETAVTALQTAVAKEAKQDSILTALGLLAKATDTQPVSAASLPLPANAATQTTLASVLSALQGTLAVNQQPRTLLTTPISRATSGDGTAIVAGTPGSVIRVVALTLLASGDVAAIIKSGSTALSGPIDLALAGNGFVLPHAPPGESWLTTNDGEDLYLNLSDAVSVGGWLVYEVA